MTSSRCIVLAAAGLGAAAGAEARQGPPPDYGLDWVTVGAPGNRAVNAEEAPGLGGYPVGAVGYEYRLTRTEVTVSHWLEYIQAFAPHWVAGGGSPLELGLRGPWITLGPSGYQAAAGAANYPTSVGWRFAARYCNWLHNGKVNEAWAFESGAYDTSTFGLGPDGTVTDQVSHSAGALYWIPTGDEWIKGAYYDTDRYGPGQEGYWHYPIGSDAVPISGLPGSGQTNAGDGAYPLLGMDVGSYPASMSPWGLLDASGGEAEWTESVAGDARARIVLGSSISQSYYMIADRVGWYWEGALPPISLAGLRVASTIPEPSAALFAIVLVLGIQRRRQE